MIRFTDKACEDQQKVSQALSQDLTSAGSKAGFQNYAWDFHMLSGLQWVPLRF